MAEMANVPLTDEGFHSAASALTTLTTAAEKYEDYPHAHLHRPADSAESHAWLKRMFPTASFDTIETRFHMGNFVIDRQTGNKTLEPMSIYVRVGMHLLYYGSEQEKALHWKRTLELLKNQSEKMGR